MTTYFFRWPGEEWFCGRYLNKNTQLLSRDHITNFMFSENPWTRALAGKKVLVLNPFDELIRSQYRKRKLLFKDLYPAGESMLPEFELTTMRTVLSLAEIKPEGFDSWFDALDAMKRRIDKIDFDVALVSAGAYGFPLADHCKNIGKKAVYLGSTVHLMFGIKGKRWDDQSYIRYNEHWDRPRPEDRPKDFNLVEGGCYW